MARNLASIQRIADVSPIEGADKIECVSILGWRLVSKKDEFRVNDLCVYIEIDSLLPTTPQFGFMARYKYRVKTIKLRGQISQGLALPLSEFPEIKNPQEGMDVTDLLGISKYEKEDDAESGIQTPRKLDAVLKTLGIYKLVKKNRFLRVLFGYSKPSTSGGFPTHIISHSDETRIQSMPGFLDKAGGLSFTETEKLDGSSGTFAMEKRGWLQKKFYICSRKMRKHENDGSVWSRIYKKYKIKDVLSEIVSEYALKAIAIQGEVIGPKIQGNPYRLTDLDFYAFRLKFIYRDGKCEVISPRNASLLLRTYGIKWVPFVGTLYYPNTVTVDEILQRVEGPSLLCAETEREGSVFVNDYDPTISFKAISNKYLIKKEKD